MTQARTKNGLRLLWHATILCGTIFGIWSTAALLSGLAQANWQFSEFLRQYLIAIGVMREFHTFVDFYTHIKGVEYIICLLFLGIFPAFYTLVNNAKQHVEAAS
ncbi:MAG: hypothetical protein A2521_03285 [Deltaproteobacteria bacterium RIFOXYD12_FULL_57_12]|nr:MAG: hypothetical protein A2521_03285 [Deltaproteobacteria bacterium RIFOXYD12_FULL_57_12]